MSRYGMGMLDDTIKKIQKRKMNTRAAGARGGSAVKAAAKPAMGKGVKNKNDAMKARKVAKTVQKTAAQGAASKMSARDRVAARVAAAKKKKGGGLRARSPMR